MLQQQQKMCDAYDAYATAVAKVAVNIKTQFSEEQKLWIPWYTAAINVAREAMLLRYASIKPYLDIFSRQDEASFKEAVAHLINDFNQKALLELETIENYQEVLNAVIQEQENPSQQSVAATALQEIDVETASLEASGSTIKKSKSEIQQSFAIKATAVNKAYPDYEKVNEEENDNLFPLSFLHDEKQRDIINLVRSTQLGEQFQQFLSQLQVHQEVNRIKGSIAPLNLKQSLEEKDMKFEEELMQGYHIVPRQSEQEYEDNK